MSRPQRSSNAGVTSVPLPRRRTAISPLLLRLLCVLRLAELGSSLGSACLGHHNGNFPLWYHNCVCKFRRIYSAAELEVLLACACIRRGIARLNYSVCDLVSDRWVHNILNI